MLFRSPRGVRYNGAWVEWRVYMQIPPLRMASVLILKFVALYIGPSALCFELKLYLGLRPRLVYPRAVGPGIVNELLTHYTGAFSF